MKRRSNTKIASGVWFAALLAILSACRSDEDKPDVSHLDGSFELIRSEQVLFEIDTTADNASEVWRAHPLFWDLYFKEIMQVPGERDTSWRKLVADIYLQAIADSVQAEYPNLTELNTQLTTAFQYLQYYFPGNLPPRVYTLISGFGYFPFIFEDGERDGIGISLEMFLGSDFPYRDFVGSQAVFSDYLIRSYNKDHISKRTLDVMVDDLVGPPPGERLLDKMIHNGIKLYITEHLLPSMADTVLFEFTPAQLKWCEENERNLWAHFLSEDLLYSDDFRKTQKLVSPAPMIPGMPAEAPGGVANWTGWRIIHALMERNTNLKMLDLLALKDPQAILEEARYRPR